jgi:hypothetical protein
VQLCKSSLDSIHLNAMTGYLSTSKNLGPEKWNRPAFSICGEAEEISTELRMELTQQIDSLAVPKGEACAIVTQFLRQHELAQGKMMLEGGGKGRKARGRGNRQTTLS